ncbi:hypothetical protein [Thiocystis violascens]|uniref:hypothetical protein n=1 Tax=Thiocystis violascens TaxID=73141 RepID=UPI00059C68A3|nr:hypothetical protein [Thiocystis violascens]
MHQDRKILRAEPVQLGIQVEHAKQGIEYLSQQVIGRWRLKRPQSGEAEAGHGEREFKLNR